MPSVGSMSSVGGIAQGGRLAAVPRGFGEKRFMRLLGLSTAAVDPVTIITAAQLRLRRWRTVGGGSQQVSFQIRQITEARDILLRQVLPQSLESARGARK